jgi:hypothetical protein
MCASISPGISVCPMTIDPHSLRARDRSRADFANLSALDGHVARLDRVSGETVEQPPILEHVNRHV